MLQMSELDESTLLEVAEFITQDEQQNITLSSLFFKDSQPDSKTDLADSSPMRCTMPAAATYLMHNGFADRSLTAWVWCHDADKYNKNQNVCLESRKTPRNRVEYPHGNKFF